MSIIINWSLKLTIGVCLFGFLFNWAISRYEKSILEPLGQFVTVKENSPPINYYCSESSNSNIFLIPGSDISYVGNY